MDTLSESSSAAKYPKNVLEKKVEHANQQLEMLHEQENVLLNLQLKAENQLREARHAQQKLLNQQNLGIPKQMHNLEDDVRVDINDLTLSSGKNFKENHEAIKELEDRVKSLNSDVSSYKQAPVHVQEQFLSQIDSLQQKVNQFRDSNDNCNQLVHILDKRDVQLQTDHAELQRKLVELQNRKIQVDNLVAQLQNIADESEEEDVGESFHDT